MDRVGDTGSKRRTCDQSGRTCTIDRISDLPDEIIQKILSFLMVDESVPTSILSKRWRYQWTFNSDLHFTDTCNLNIIRACIKQNQTTQPNGFHLKYRCDDDGVREMEELLDFITRGKIRKLTLKTLNMVTDSFFTVPSSLFSSRTLESLKLDLDNCVVELPMDINCFESLLHLSLKSVRVNREFASIISRFHRLQTLKLHWDIDELFEFSISLPELQKLSLVLMDCHTLKVHAPNLQDLYFVGNGIQHCYLEKTPYLRKVCFLNENRNALEFLIHCIATVQTLSIFNFDLKQYIQNGSKGPRLALKNLRKITLRKCFSYSHLSCLFQECPLLEEINVVALSTQRDKWGDWEERLQDEDAKLASEFVDKSLGHLKMVKMEYFSGAPREMALIKLLLREAEVLQTVRLQIHFDSFTRDYMDWLLERVTMFPKISASASIEPYFYGNKFRRLVRPLLWSR